VLRTETYILLFVYLSKTYTKSTMGKDKKEKRKSEALDDTIEGVNSKDVYDEKLKHLNKISQPLASRKLMKKICKTIKKGIDAIQRNIYYQVTFKNV